MYLVSPKYLKALSMKLTLLDTNVLLISISYIKIDEISAFLFQFYPFLYIVKKFMFYSLCLFLVNSSLCKKVTNIPTFPQKH